MNATNFEPPFVTKVHEFSRWSWTHHAAPVLWRDGVLYAAEGKGAVAAIEPESGRVKWRVTVPGFSSADVRSPLQLDGDLLLVTSIKGVTALDPATGAQRWKRHVLESNAALIDGDDIYLLGSGKLRCVKRSTGKNQWMLKQTLNGTSLSRWEDKLIVMAGGPLCVDLTTREVLWRGWANSTSYLRPLEVHGGRLYVQNYDPEVGEHFAAMARFQFLRGASAGRLDGMFSLFLGAHKGIVLALS